MEFDKSMERKEVAVIIGWTALAFCQLPVFGQKMLQAYRYAGGVRGLSRAARSICGRRHQGPHDDTMGAEGFEMVEKLLRERRVRLARTVIICGWAASCLHAFLRVIGYVAMRQSSPEALGQSARWLLGTVYGLIPLTMGAMFSDYTVTERTLQWWLWSATGVVVVAIVLSPYAGSGPQSMFMSWPNFVVYSATIGGTYLHFPSLILSSLSISVSYVFAFSQAKPDYPGQTIDMAEIARQELTCWIWKLGLFYWAEGSMTSSIRHEVNAALGKCQGSAVRSLLDLICDAVVDLEASLALKEHSEKLAALVMCRAGRTLAGSSLSDFIARDDQERFKSMFSAGGTENEEGSLMPPSMLVANMSDVSGNRFKATLYQMPYLNIQGRRNHLVGMLESNEEFQHFDAPGPRRVECLPAAQLRPEFAGANAGGANQPSHASASMGSSARSSLSVGSGSGGGGASSDGESEGTDDECGVLQVPDAAAEGAGGSAAQAPAARSPGGSDGETLTVVAEASLPIVGGSKHLVKRFGLGKGGGGCHGFTQMVVSKSGAENDLEAYILKVAGAVARNELSPHTGALGVFKFSAPGQKKDKKFKVIVDFWPQLIGCEDPRHLLRVRLVEPDKQKNRWKTQDGPLRQQQRATTLEERSKTHISV